VTVVSQQGASLRFAPHLHLEPHDVARLLGAIAATVA
jgi:hypothetical protein